MIVRIVTVKVLAAVQWIDYWHRVLLDTSPAYRQGCTVIAAYIATGTWGHHHGPIERDEY